MLFWEESFGKMSWGFQALRSYKLLWEDGNFLFLSPSLSMWDLSSPTRDQTPTPCNGSSVLTTGTPEKSLFFLLNGSWRMIAQPERTKPFLCLFCNQSFLDCWKCVWPYSRILGNPFPLYFILVIYFFNFTLYWTTLGLQFCVSFTCIPLYFRR